MGEISGDHTVEVVTDAMLDKLVAQFNHVAVLFYDKESEDSAAVLEALVKIFCLEMTDGRSNGRTLVSILPTCYEQLFRTQLFWKAFLYLHFVFVFFGQKKP